MSDKVAEVIAEALSWSRGRDGVGDWSVEAADVLAALEAAGIVLMEPDVPVIKFGHVRPYLNGPRCDEWIWVDRTGGYWRFDHDSGFQYADSWTSLSPTKGWIYGSMTHQMEVAPFMAYEHRPDVQGVWQRYVNSKTEQG